MFLAPRHHYFFIALILLVTGCSNGNKEKFDRKKWLQGDQRERGRMAEDLYSSGILTGKTKEQTIELIGIPGDSTATRYYYAVDLGETYVHDMIINFDSISLVIDRVWFDD